MSPNIPINFDYRRAMVGIYLVGIELSKYEECFMERKYLLAKMTWPEVEEILKETDIALVPIGAIEQHGPALPVDNDAHIATEFTTRVAERIWSKQKVVVIPTISFGFSPHHMQFKGTITLSESTLANMIVDVCKSLEHHGFKRIILINGHGGNTTAISNALHTMSGAVKANTPEMEKGILKYSKHQNDKLYPKTLVKIFYSPPITFNRLLKKGGEVGGNNQPNPSNLRLKKGVKDDSAAPGLLLAFDGGHRVSLIGHRADNDLFTVRGGG